MYTDEQLAKMNAYFKDGNALRSTMRSILKDLIREYKQLRDEKEQKEKHPLTRAFENLEKHKETFERLKAE